MSFDIFISHSIAPADQHIMRRLCEHLMYRPGIWIHPAERKLEFGQAPIEKLEQPVREADCVIAVLTCGGEGAAYVNQELGIAAKLGKFILTIVESGVDLSGLQTLSGHLMIDRKRPMQWMTTLHERLTELETTDEIRAMLMWALVAAAGAIVDERRK